MPVRCPECGTPMNQPNVEKGRDPVFVYSCSNCGRSTVKKKEVKPEEVAQDERD